MYSKKKWIIAGLSAAVVIVGLLIWLVPSQKENSEDTSPAEEQQVDLLYGIDPTPFVIEEGVIESGQTLSSIFAKYGIGPAMVDKTAKAADSVFSLRNIRAGNDYTVFLTADSLNQLRHFVYEQNPTEYLKISFEGDSVSVCKEQKEIDIERQVRSAEITSSLWNSMVDAGMSYALAVDVENIYQWTIDFFGLQQGDHFTIIYDELFADDTVSVGVGRVWGGVFNHMGKDYYAIPFKKEGKITYWDENGNSLRKGFLKAPLQYSRISSKFSSSRLHPILRIRRPHYGVDYAAPSGTPVVAVADGVVTFKGWGGGGGNTLKIKHSSDFVTGYLHLRGFAKGIAVGTYVSQGDLIGYVGSTGSSTGPHLDYRIWKGGKPIDPLKMTAEPGEPLSQAEMPDFEIIRDRIMAELRGQLSDSLRVTQLDSLAVYKAAAVPLLPQADSIK